MKTTSRKRLLVSSVAMLLVAMLALGTATYAWFTSSTEAYADNMYVRTTKVSNLQINSKLDSTWRTHVDYGVGSSADNQKLTPASTANGVDWYYADAVKGDAFAANTATKVGTAPADNKNFNDYYFADQLNIKNAGQVTCENVKITVSGLTGDYSRLAIVPVTEKGGTTIAPLASAPEKTKWTDYIIDTQGETYNAAKGTSLRKLDTDGKTWIVDTANVVSVTASSETVIEVGNMDAEDVKYFNVYVWFEGQDVDCKNANSGQNIPALKFSVTGTAAAD